MQATYRNDTGQPLRQIVMNVEPNRRPGIFSLDRFESDSLANFTLTGPRLEATLKAPLAVSCEVTFSMAFSVKPSAIAQTYVGNIGYFGYTDRQMTLGVWLPEFAPVINSSFFTAKVWPLGEYEVSEWSDFAATVKVQGKDDDKQQVIGPGEAGKDGNIWTFRLEGGRTFTLSISQEAKVTTQSDDGVTIDLYYFAPDQKTAQPKTADPQIPETNAPNAAQFALETARTALNRYSKLFGPLPYNRLAVVEGDFQDGMEFSGLVYVGQHWVANYDGTPGSWLALITAHEIAHQWWYSLVGDDQGNTPVMDEGFAVYSESLYVEDQYPTLLNWWWAFRVTTYGPLGYVDSKVYDFQNLRLYLNAGYLRGALMLQDIRKAIGDEAFFQWLRDYRSAEAGKIATLPELWQAISPGDYAKTAPIRAKHLRNPDPLHPPPPTHPCCR